MSEALLTVEDLRVTFPGRHAPVEAVRGLSFSLGRERLGIVGESGSGKSVTARAVMGLLPGVTAKRMTFDGEDLLSLSPRGWRRLRGRRLGMILQDPKYSLNPVMRVGAQLVEALRQHHAVSRAEARRRALAMLEAVRIHDPERVFAAWPHQLSGGLGQRVMIAMMLLPEPDLLIADEPTSALDVTVSLQVLALLDELVSARGMGLLLISHDLTLVSGFCDRVAVMYAGRIVETLSAARLEEARHPYTRGLLAARPRLDRPAEALPTLRRDPAWKEAQSVDAFLR